MRIVFAGTPDFAAHAMRAIIAAGHTIVLVLTQPDRRAGRGMHFQASPVKAYALEENIPVLQPETLKQSHPDAQKSTAAKLAYQQLCELEFDVMVVVAYGLILPQNILDIAEQAGRYGCFNIHASMLPRWRGAAPIQRAIESGDAVTGVSIMQMDAGLDTGDVVLDRGLVISAQETSASLHDRLADLGAQLMVEVLNALDRKEMLSRLTQATEGITYAEKIRKSESEIDWDLSAIEIDRRIRAFNPFPGATSSLQGEQVKFWNSSVPNGVVSAGMHSSGELIGLGDNGVYVQCGEGVLEVLEVQKSGGKKLPAKQYFQLALSEDVQSKFEKNINKRGGSDV